MKTIRRELAPFRVREVDDRRLRFLRWLSGILPRRSAIGTRARNTVDALAPAFGLLRGEQTTAYLRAAAWRSPALTASATSPHENGAGLMWFVPTLPATGEAVVEVRGAVTEIYHRHGFDAPITLTFVNERTLIATTNISFNRSDPSDVAAAERCYRDLNETLLALGYPPYRSGVGGFGFLHDGSSFWRAAGRIKDALDPDGVISPGRYLPER